MPPGRPPEPQKKADLLEAAADYVTAHGLADLSLRPLARTLRTSARMLLYHFGSRDALVREALAVIRRREDASIRAWWEAGGRSRTLPEFLRSYWKRLSAPEAEPTVRLVFEAYGAALRDPRSQAAAFARGPVGYWRRLLARDPALRNEETATLALAVVRGLLLDLLTSGERRRVGRALGRFAALLEAATPAADPPAAAGKRGGRKRAPADRAR